MKKVAILLHGLSSGGIDAMFARLSAFWDQQRFHMTYILASDEGSKQLFEDMVKKNGSSVVFVHDLDKKRYLKWPVSLRRVLDKTGPYDIVHSNMNMLDGINLWTAKRSGIPVRISHAHVAAKQLDGRIDRRVYITVMRRLIRNNSTVRVACSDKAGNKFYGANNYQLIFNGIPLNKFKKPMSHAGMKTHGFLFVGRLVPWKNPFFLMDVFYEIHRKMPGSSLTIVGNGPLQQGLETYVSELGLTEHVIFTGVRTDVESIMQEHQYFLFPTLYEGFGNVLIEAQAADLLCFSSDQVPETTNCGKCIFIPIQKSAEEWARIITEEIESGKQRTVDQDLLSQFDIQRMANDLMELYDTAP